MIKDRVADSLELFAAGFHCSQAVLAPFGEELGLPRETALKIACPFGGGLGGYGRTCGALTGAMMVVGLKYGSADATDLEAKKRSREITRQLIGWFESEHGTSQCNELVGFDRSHFTSAELMDRRPIFNKICPRFIETVVAYLEENI